MAANMASEVAGAIEKFFAERTQGPWMVSTSRALRRVRAELPDCPLEDREIERMIAEYAVARGFNVSLDAGEANGQAK